ncbi:hypothetical protein EV127DRAFT_478862 [Xylaria flabelliformis]|nr:hypothetical protein EV127DRAFT_478862 [Xylaria flabelliformis]
MLLYVLEAVYSVQIEDRVAEFFLIHYAGIFFQLGSWAVYQRRAVYAFSLFAINVPL